MRIFLADFSTREQLDLALKQVREDADSILEVGRVVGAEYLAGTAPFQDQVHVRALVLDFLSHHARMLRDWADRVEGVLDQWAEPSHDREQIARDIIRANLAEDPPA
jgi:hypothetical protein